jgi:hypothetical protein
MLVEQHDLVEDGLAAPEQREMADHLAAPRR